MFIFITNKTGSEFVYLIKRNNKKAAYFTFFIRQNMQQKLFEIRLLFSKLHRNPVVAFFEVNQLKT